MMSRAPKRRSSAWRPTPGRAYVGPHDCRFACPAICLDAPGVDRRLANKNIRTGLIAGAIALIVFALAWVVGLVY
jgi:hypothetical protein